MNGDLLELHGLLFVYLSSTVDDALPMDHELAA